MIHRFLSRLAPVSKMGKGSKRWIAQAENLNPKPSPATHTWLTQPYVLSQALKQHCRILKVSVLSMQKEAPHPDELHYLPATHRQAAPLIRQVFLCGDSKPWVYARVVIPESTYLAYQNEWDRLGESLIGETLLYKNPHTKRSTFEFSAQSIQTLSALYPSLLPFSKKANVLFGRRSLFSLNQHPLIVSEFFLPDLPEPLYL